MSKIIENSTALINAFIKAFYKEISSHLQCLISEHVPEAVIASAAKNIAVQVISEYDLRDIYYEQTEESTDEYFSVLTYLTEKDASGFAHAIQCQFGCDRRVLKELIERFSEDVVKTSDIA